MGGAIVVVQRAGTEIGWLDGLTDDVRLTDPRTLHMGENDGDNVTRFLEGLYERVDVGGGLV